MCTQFLFKKVIMYPVQDKEQLKEIPNIMSVMETS